MRIDYSLTISLEVRSSGLQIEKMVASQKLSKKYLYTYIYIYIYLYIFLYLYNDCFSFCFWIIFRSPFSLSYTVVCSNTILCKKFSIDIVGKTFSQDVHLQCLFLYWDVFIICLLTSFVIKELLFSSKVDVCNETQYGTEWVKFKVSFSIGRIF